MRHVICVMIGVLAGAGLVAAGAAQEPAGGATVASAAGGPTCTMSGCHSQIRQHQHLHEPVATNRCDACHEPKKGATPFQAGVRHEFKRAADKPELCYACHDRLAQDAYVHQPVKMGVCVLCHDPHGAEHASFLRVDTDRKLCAQCHRVTFEQGDHVHPPVSDGVCGACHDPHGSDYKQFLVAAPPELCLDCHDTIEELLDDATVAHDPVTTGSSCLGCHDPHASDVERLLVGESMALCLSCHDKELDSEDGKIRNMAEHLEANPNHHGPVKDKNCSACHNPHGGTTYRLLTEAYPAEAYAPYDEDGYALCLGCHDVEMVEEERDEEATEFRNGDLNLHYVHVNREKQGTTCGACHDVHASDNAMHIVDPASFNAEGIQMAYKTSPTGGSCVTQCHAIWAYDRIQPVQNE